MGSNGKREKSSPKNSEAKYYRCKILLLIPSIVHIIYHQQLKPDRDKVEAILTSKEPSFQEDLDNYFSKCMWSFIDHYTIQEIQATHKAVGIPARNCCGIVCVINCEYCDNMLCSRCSNNCEFRCFQVNLQHSKSTLQSALYNNL